MIRLAYIASRYPEVSHTFILREVQALRARGFDVHTFAVRQAQQSSVLSAADRDEFARTSSLLPTSVFKLAGAHLRLATAAPGRYLRALKTALTSRPAGLRSLVWSVFYFAEAGLLAAEMRRRGVGHVHAHFANVAASVARLAAEIIGGSWSITLHGLADFGNPQVNHLRAKIASARLIICISRFGQSQAMLNSDPAHWDRIVRIPCGVDLRAFAPPERRHDGLPKTLRLLTVGRLSPEKGHRVLLEALRILHDRGVTVHATWVGNGPQRQALGELAGRLGVQEYVTFAGAVGQDDIAAYYEQADAFVLPSFAEGLPVVLMEAMAMGVPVVASGIMGIPELITSGANGLLVPPADATALADAIGALADDPDLRIRLGAAGRERVLREHDLSASAQRLAGMFEEMLGPEPAAGEARRPRALRMSAGALASSETAPP